MKHREKTNKAYVCDINRVLAQENALEVRKKKGGTTFPNASIHRDRYLNAKSDTRNPNRQTHRDTIVIYPYITEFGFSFNL